MLERQWPGVVTVNRRFGRPQHIVSHAWQKFTTPLQRKEGLVTGAEPNEYGMRLVQVKPLIKSAWVRGLADEIALPAQEGQDAERRS